MLPIVTALLTPHVQALRRPSSSLARGVAALPAGCVFVLYSTYSFLPPPEDIRKVGSPVAFPSLYFFLYSSLLLRDDPFIYVPLHSSTQQAWGLDW